MTLAAAVQAQIGNVSFESALDHFQSQGYTLDTAYSHAEFVSGRATDNPCDVVLCGCLYEED